MKHNTPGITLEQSSLKPVSGSLTLAEFIAAKPKELRLGQWFVNCYWKGSDYKSQQLFQLDGYAAKLYIISLMDSWNWETLPELPE
jgi:hypothetical protein